METRLISMPRRNDPMGSEMADGFDPPPDTADSAKMRSVAKKVVRSGSNVGLGPFNSLQTLIYAGEPGMTTCHMGYVWVGVDDGRPTRSEPQLSD